MNRLTKLSSVIATAAVALVFSSCSMPTKGPRNAFSFDPSAKKPTGAVKVHISTTAQRVYVTQGDEVLLATPCSVGTSASPTPKGEHRILSKTRHRRRASSPERVIR